MTPRWSVAALPFLLAAPVAGDGFPSHNVTLLSHVPLEAFATNPTSGNDCWGYVSSSGREYALMGLRTAVGVVEITNPTQPVIIAEVTHSSSNWCDIKVYGDHAYAVNESGGGIDVIDLSNVDNGVVTLVQRVTDGGVDRSHNVAIDEECGFLYLAGSNLSSGRLVAFDLADPANPVLAGQMSAAEGDYVHDAQIVSFTTGPNAGKQICFASVGSFGLDIYDVTDKTAMFRLSRTSYPNLSYAHQAWLSEDRQLLYLNDELDMVNETVIFDVSDLGNPAVVGSSTSGLTAGDHNVYVHDGFIYEAEYRGGMRVFDAADPLNPVQVGWFDTYPEGDNAGFNGAWSVYPFFPSGNVIISDKNRALFVVRPGPAPIAFSFPGGVPDLIGPTAPGFVIEIESQDGFVLDPSSPKLHHDIGGGFVETPLIPLGGSAYGADFGVLDCATTVRFYTSAETTSGLSLTDPPSGPCAPYIALAGLDATVPFADDLEADNGWIAGLPGDDAISGIWTRVDPIGTASQPEDDHTLDPGAACYVTGQGPEFGGIGEADVDEGATTLRTPLLDLTGDGEAVISFWLWYSNDFQQLDADEGAGPSEDVFVIDISGDHGGSWSNVLTIGPSGDGTTGGWTYYSFRVADIVEPTAAMYARFVASDVGNLSIVEAAVDDFTATLVTCAESLPGDVDGDGIVGIIDFLLVLGAWGPCPRPCPPCAADFDGDCVVGIGDFLIVLGSWTP